MKIVLIFFPLYQNIYIFLFFFWQRNLQALWSRKNDEDNDVDDDDGDDGDYVTVPDHGHCGRPGKDAGDQN